MVRKLFSKSKKEEDDWAPPDKINQTTKPNYT
jgi:hypothetical protein